MDREIQKRFEAAYRAIVEMNRLAWKQWPRRRAEEEANKEALKALDALARNGYDLVLDNDWLAQLKAKNYAGVGSQPGDPDGVKERPKEATPELQKRVEFADRRVKEINRQAWLDTGMTEAEYDESNRCSEAWCLIDAYGYKGVLPDEDEPAGTSYTPVMAKEMAARK